MSMTAKEEEFRSVMKIVGLDSTTVDMLQRCDMFETLEKYNRREYPASLRNLNAIATNKLNSHDMENLEAFRDFYTDLEPSKRRNMLAHFDSDTWNDHKQARRDRKMEKSHFLFKLGIAVSMLWLISILPVVLLQWQSLGSMQAQLDKSCSLESSPIAVNCLRVQCPCCYQGEKDLLGNWVASDKKCS